MKAHVLIWLVGLSLVLATLWRTGRQTAIRPVILFALVVIVLRWILFDTTMAWTYYRNWLQHHGSNDHLAPALVLMEINSRSIQASTKAPRYMALGSSQIETMLNNERFRAEGGRMHSRVASFPFDYFFHFEQFARTEPEMVILLVSVADLARMPRIDWMPFLPAQGRAAPWITTSALLRHRRAVGPLRRHLSRFVVAEVVPEFKFSPIARAMAAGATKDWLGEIHDLRPIRSPVHFRPYPLAPRAMELQFEFLSAFVKTCDQRGIAVLILEGQIFPPPDYRTADVNEESRRVREAVSRLARSHALVNYVPLTEQPPLDRRDYSDRVHLRPESALRFTNALFDRGILASDRDRRTEPHPSASSGRGRPGERPH